MFVRCYLVFVFKQKTAYEMRISDWSSDVCSSDLDDVPEVRAHFLHGRDHVRHARLDEASACDLRVRDEVLARPGRVALAGAVAVDVLPALVAVVREIGRASCRERVCQDV